MDRREFLESVVAVVVAPQLPMPKTVITFEEVVEFKAVVESIERPEHHGKMLFKPVWNSLCDSMPLGY